MLKENTHKVTVVMNVHNGDQFIKNSIQSVINQSYLNWELIIWDNASVDKTFFLASRFKDKRIKYFKSDYFDTLYAARNKAIKKAKGSLITFLDVDDLWLPNKLEAQVKVMMNPDIEFCYSNYYQIGDRGLNYFSKKAFNKLPNGYIHRQLISNYKVGILTLCIRKETVIKKNLLFDPRFSIIGDMIFVLKLSKLGIAYADQRCLACYRSHFNNLSKRKVLLQVREMRKWFSEIKKSGKWDDKELKNLISLTNYQRAKGINLRLSFMQVINATYKISKFSLIVKFLIFYFFQLIKKLFTKMKKNRIYNL